MASVEHKSMNPSKFFLASTTHLQKKTLNSPNSPEKVQSPVSLQRKGSDLVRRDSQDSQRVNAHSRPNSRQLFRNNSSKVLKRNSSFKRLIEVQRSTSQDAVDPECSSCGEESPCPSNFDSSFEAAPVEKVFDTTFYECCNIFLEDKGLDIVCDDDIKETLYQKSKLKVAKATSMPILKQLTLSLPNIDKSTQGPITDGIQESSILKKRKGIVRMKTFDVNTTSNNDDKEEFKKGDEPSSEPRIRLSKLTPLKTLKKYCSEYKSSFDPVEEVLTPKKRDSSRNSPLRPFNDVLQDFIEHHNASGRNSSNSRKYSDSDKEASSQLELTSPVLRLDNVQADAHYEKDETHNNDSPSKNYIPSIELPKDD